MKRIRKFWATAMYYGTDGRENKISTSNPSATFEDAWNQIIDYWKHGYNFNIFKAWIDIYENGEKVSQAYIIKEPAKEDY